jgi:hypothetical protein
MQVPLLNPPLYRKQVEALHSLSKAGDQIGIVAWLGGFASGKTTLGTVGFIATCLQNGWHPGYGRGRPRAFAIAPTAEVARDTTITALEAIVPPELILKRLVQPYRLTLINGCEIHVRSVKSSIEGVNLAAMLLEEITHENYWRDIRTWPNLVSRVRDPLAPQKRIIATGLPGANIRPYFERDDVELTRFATTDNPAITSDVLAEIRSSCPAGMEETYLSGEWISVEGAVFLQFDVKTHLTEDPPATAAATHVALDVGNHSHLLFFQAGETRVRGITGQGERSPALFVIDELATLGLSIDDLCTRARVECPYTIDARSHICVDPTLRRDELATVRKHFPQSRIVQRGQNDPLYYREEGIRLLQWGLKDAFGNVRIRLAKKLEGSHRGAVYALQNSRRNPRTGQVVRDDVIDHAGDTLRYAASFALGDVRRGPTMSTV